ncbi:MAG TPA: hypothetical protein VIR98_01445 [Candidatus Paceibacterota bacterium]|jgi:hypothetical protein
MKHIRHFFTKHRKEKIEKATIWMLLVANISLAILLFAHPASAYPEVKELAGNHMTFTQLSTYFNDLAKRKGAVYAFDVLKRAHIPPNTDIHLLGHGIGDILYEQKGTGGMVYCTRDFRNACSHQIVINTLLQKGPQSFPDIVEACKKAPGGRNGYSMCFHGLGHGVLAYNGYDLAKGMEMCNLSGPARGEEVVQCMGGAVMEMMAGVHDPEIWREQSKKYFSTTDPLAPCDTSIIPPEGKRICYIYLTPHLFERAGQKQGTKPVAENLKRAMSYCEQLSGNDRKACYGGFGKEYAPMAHDKDIRNIGTMSDHELDTALYWCSLAPKADGANYCISEAVRSLYWAGDVDPAIPTRFCVLADNWGYGKSCAEAFIGSVAANRDDPTYRKNICDHMPTSSQGMCRSRLLPEKQQSASR